MKDKLMKAEEVANYLRVDKFTIWRWASKGVIPTIRLTKKRLLRFRPSDIEKFLKEKTNVSI